MENCYVLLGIPPTAGTEEIEEAYQRKKKEFGADASRLQELDGAYNEAIMATFAPIRAFSSPLPPLTIGKNPPQPQAVPVQPAPAQALPQAPSIQSMQQIPVQAPPVQAELALLEQAWPVPGVAGFFVSRASKAATATKTKTRVSARKSPLSLRCTRCPAPVALKRPPPPPFFFSDTPLRFHLWSPLELYPTARNSFPF